LKKSKKRNEIFTVPSEEATISMNKEIDYRVFMTV